MKLKTCKILFLLFIVDIGVAQNTFFGCVLGSNYNKSLADVEIHDFYDGFITKTDESLPNLHGKDEPTNSMIFGSSDQGPDQFS